MKQRALKIFFPLGIIAVFLSVLNSCKKDDPDPVPTLTFANAALSCQVGSKTVCANVVTSSVSGGGAITYSITPATVATVDATTGVITPVAAGTATVTATQAASVGKNGSASATYTLTITAPDPTPTLTFAAGPYTCAVGSSSACTWIATSSITGGGAITYTIDQTTVATINATTGVITPVTPGTATVTATQAALAGKNASASATYTLTVTGLSITSFSPLFGGVGYEVVITGTNFDGSVAANNIVTINGVATAVPTNTSTTSLKVLVPKGASGAGDIKVKVGTQTATKGTFTEYATITTFAGDGTQGWKDDTGLKAQFWSPAGLAIDNSGNLLVADGGNNRIRSITPDGLVTTIAGDGSYDYLDGNGTSAELNNPHGIAVNPRTGMVYVTDKGDNHIRKINLSTGAVTTYAGSTYDGDGHDNGTNLTDVQFDQPQGLAIDAFDNIYMTDRWFSLVREVLSGGSVFSVAGNAQSNYVNGPGNNSGLYFPDGIVVDPSGDFLLVADYTNHAIRKITIQGVIEVSTFAGTTTGTSGGTADGTGTAASFTGPTGLVYDAAGNVYVTDDIGLIRKITPTGVVTTIAGRLDLGDGTPFLDGLGPFAKIAGPQGITIDADGNLYVTDSSNRIRKIVP